MMETDILPIESFYQELAKHIEHGKEVSTRQIYSLFPDSNPKTLSWRLHKLVQLGKLHRSGQGYYSLLAIRENNAAGYDYIQRKSQTVYDVANNYGYDFYITGLDSLIGELLHVPEKYPVLLVLEESGVNEIQEALSNMDFIVFTEKERSIAKKAKILNKTDVYILKGKTFTLSVDHIAQKEKGFVDLYYAVTRMEYGISVPELSRIFQNLQRNQALAALKMKHSARDRGIATELNWLMELGKATEKTKEFMSYQIKEA